MALFEYIEDLPGIEFSVQREPITDAALAEHIARQNARIRRRLGEASAEQRRVYVIQDNRGFPGASARQRQMLAQWLQDEAATLRLTVLGMGFVLDSTLLRGALTAVFWLSNMPMPHRVYGTLQEAIDQGIQMCDAADVAVAPSLRTDGAAAVRARLPHLYGSVPSHPPHGGP